ncbi:hypothetical protein HD599_001636 [Conyzicola lurida]|uniref:Uncharacterized protein n=1 Tax=Conyzicola lurida TaxID=1172621 RepID=A0A841ANY4_9MICO|nr:hypothetical protein [Conyzicola lurida]MBB5843313.1 hypothetical protein [Conyzicola lurida]
MNRRLGLLAVTLAAAALLTGCSAGGGAEEACLEPIEAQLGEDVFTDVKVTERIQTPGGALDIRGTFAGGEFGCGLTTPNTLEQAMVFMDDGSAVSIDF